MKEVCGFTDVRGNFHETQKECEIAEIKYKIEGTKKILENFEERIQSYIFWGNGNKPANYENYRKFRTEILNAVAKAVLERSNEFIAIINEKENIAKELNELEKIYKDETQKPWWLKIKWWN